ncbi:MAG: ABC transporter ATP-binding protein [Anaerolineae bacterium]|nr:ABC transporter ATP-binding protein [Anaerolineae bacterium]
MASSNDVLLRVEDLQTVFRAREGLVRAVRGVSFEVRRGEKVGIVGESGSGKSALALSILRLIAPPGEVVGGQVWLNDRDLMRLREREMAHVRGSEIALIFQDPMTALDPVMTIGAQIVESIRKHRPDVSRKEARDRAIELLRDVEVPLAERRIDDYPHQLSGGMRQRVVIAIALANDPPLLIADEPTTALDVTTQAQVLDVLERAVEERGAAVILITHNLGIVADFCDSVKVMYAGRLVEQATPTDLFRSPIHPYSEALLRSIPDPARLEQGPLPTIPGAPPSLANLPAGCAFEPRCPLGRGVAICKNTAPPVIPIGQGVAECHFAEERWADNETMRKEAAADDRS